MGYPKFQLTPSPFAKGSVLILLLIIGMGITLLILTCTDISFLQLKMVSQYQAKMEVTAAAQQQLRFLERQIERNFYEKMPPGVSFLQWVPDTLAWGEKEGITYYQIKVKNEKKGAHVQLQSTVATRARLSTPIFLSTERGIEQLSFSPFSSQMKWPLPSLQWVSMPVYDEKLKRLYALSRDFQLYVINLAGKIEKILPLAAKDALSGSWQQTLLALTKQGLVVRLPTSPERIIVLDKISLEKKWEWEVPATFTAHLPVVARLGDQQENAIVVSYSPSLERALLTILELATGKEVRQWQAGALQALSPLVAVDSAHQGYADFLYGGDLNGALWKIKTADLHPWQWQLSVLPLGESQLVGQPWIGPHPQGQGLLIYLLGKKVHQRAPSCVEIIWDPLTSDTRVSRYLKIEGNGEISALRLRQNALLVVSGEKLKHYHAWSGKELSAEPLYPFISFTTLHNDIGVTPSFWWDERPDRQQPFFIVPLPTGWARSGGLLTEKTLGRKGFLFLN